MEVFNMDIFNDRFIETGLNAVGYAAAGLLWMLVYSAFSRRGKRSEVSATQSEAVSERNPRQVPPVRASVAPARSEFVSLDSGAQSAPEISSKLSNDAGMSTGGRRDRGEIIRIAREMVRNGVAQDMIKRTLPITDGELSLLIQRTK